jgi:hypothetical protein
MRAMMRVGQNQYCGIHWARSLSGTSLCNFFERLFSQCRPLVADALASKAVQIRRCKPLRPCRCRVSLQLSKTACTHKCTKSALTQLNASLTEDLAAAGVIHIGVHNVSPGMVLTDLLLKVLAIPLNSVER